MFHRSTATALAAALAILPASAGAAFDAEAWFRARQQLALDHTLVSAANGLGEQIARLERNAGPLNLQAFQNSFDKLSARRDTSDFDATHLVRILYQYADAPLMTPELKAQIEQVMIHFKYWVDEPGVDPMVYWSENHNILFHSHEYLMGQMFPDTVFPNSGMTGAEHQAKARDLMLRWFELRAKTGFSEWRSTIYYEEDWGPLVNLVDFAEDPVIRDLARGIADLLFFDVAVSSHAGGSGGSHGRTSEGHAVNPRGQSITASAHMVFGQGVFNRTGGVSFSPLSVTGYVPAAAVILAGQPEHQPDVWTDKAQMGIGFDNAADYRLTTDRDDFRSLWYWWSAGQYAVADVIDATFNAANQYELFSAGDFFPAFSVFNPLWELGILDDTIRNDPNLTSLTQIPSLTPTHAIVHHKPGGLIGSAQDKMVGHPSAQNQSWSAILGPEIQVLTTHPLTGGSDYLGYFLGGASHPRIAQEEDVALILYNPDILWPPFISDESQMTHAHFPFALFDETQQVGNWYFGRKDDTYIALYSHNATYVPDDTRFAGAEIIAPGQRNLWICELGWAGEDGTFGEFVDRVSGQAVTFSGAPDFAVTYASDLGTLEFDWTGPLLVGGVETPITGYPRFSNPFTHVEFGDRYYEITAGGETSVIDLALGTCVDTDADGYGDPASPECDQYIADCDDTASAVNPGAAEVPGNGADDDCDGEVDEVPPLCGALPVGGLDGGGAAGMSIAAGIALALACTRRRAR